MRVKDLKNAPQWLKDADVSGENVEIINGQVIWYSGNFLGGNFRGGNFRGQKVVMRGMVGPIGSEDRNCYCIITKEHQMIRAGCFVGTIAELKKRAKSEGKQDYVRLCNWLNRELKIRLGSE